MDEQIKNIEKKRRLVILSLYDPEGIVDEYVFYLMKSFHLISSRIIVVSNSIISMEQQSKIREYTDDIVIRENIGYDGGAYKYVITEYLRNEDWSKWDQLVLSNDTYYGPLYKWENMFEEMSKYNVDFWGITRWAAQTGKDGVFYNDHIQGYFVVLNNSVLQDTDIFKNFWLQLKYPNNIKEAIMEYEIGLSQYLLSHGFKFSAYMDYLNIPLNLGRANLYLSNPLELIEAGIPVLKRRALHWIWDRRIKKCMQYVKQYCDYNSNYIEKNITRLDSIKYILSYNSQRIIEFSQNHKYLYIYGYGKIAHKLHNYLQDRGINIVKFVVTMKECTNDDVAQIDEITYEKNYIGIFVGTGIEFSSEIYSSLKDRGYLSSDIFTLV